MTLCENHQLDNSPASGNLAPDERETNYTFDDSSPVCHCFTSNKTLIKKLDGYVEKHPDVYKCIRHHGHSAFYEFPKKYISIRPPRTVSEEQRAAAAERLKKYHKNGSQKRGDSI